MLRTMSKTKILLRVTTINDNNIILPSPLRPAVKKEKRKNTQWSMSQRRLSTNNYTQLE